MVLTPDFSSIDCCVGAPSCEVMRDSVSEIPRPATRSQYAVGGSDWSTQSIFATRPDLASNVTSKCGFIVALLEYAQVGNVSVSVPAGKALSGSTLGSVK